MIPMKRFCYTSRYSCKQLPLPKNLTQSSCRHYGRWRYSHKNFSAHPHGTLPGAATAEVVEAVIHDRDAIIPAPHCFEGEYGESDLCIGVPCVLGKGGIKRFSNLTSMRKRKSFQEKRRGCSQNKCRSPRLISRYVIKINSRRFFGSLFLLHITLCGITLCGCYRHHNQSYHEKYAHYHGDYIVYDSPSDSLLYIYNAAR